MALKRLLFYANLRISGCIFDGGARGWIQYFRQTNDERLINKLDWVVGNLRKRFLVPPDASLKTFTRAYWAVKHPGARHGNYVPNFDEWTVPQKRDLLIDLGVDRAHEFLDDEVQYRFRKVVGAAVSDLENDIGSLS